MSAVCVLAGCVEPMAEPACAVDCDPAPPTVPTSQGAAWEGCLGLVASLEVPRERVRPLVPSSFDVRGLSEETASLLLELMACPRAAFDEALLSDVSLARLQARVQPVDEAWKGGPGGSHFVLLTMVAGGGGKQALSALGVDAQDSGVLVDHVETPASVGVARWRFESAGANLELEITAPGGSAEANPATIHYWHPAADGLRRIDATKDRDLDSALPRAGLLRFVGGPIELYGWPWTGQAYGRLDETWTALPERFGGVP